MSIIIGIFTFFIAVFFRKLTVSSEHIALLTKHNYACSQGNWQARTCFTWECRSTCILNPHTSIHSLMRSFPQAWYIYLQSQMHTNCKGKILSLLYTHCFFPSLSTIPAILFNFLLAQRSNDRSAVIIASLALIQIRPIPLFFFFLSFFPSFMYTNVTKFVVFIYYKNYFLNISLATYTNNTII